MANKNLKVNKVTKIDRFEISDLSMDRIILLLKKNFGKNISVKTIQRKSEDSEFMNLYMAIVKDLITDSYTVVGVINLTRNTISQCQYGIKDSATAFRLLDREYLTVVEPTKKEVKSA